MWILATFKEKAATFNYAYHTMLSLYQYLFVNLVVFDMGFCEPFFSLCQFLIIALIPSTSMPCHNRSESTNCHHFIVRHRNLEYQPKRAIASIENVFAFFERGYIVHNKTK